MYTLNCILVHVHSFFIGTCQLLYTDYGKDSVNHQNVPQKCCIIPYTYDPLSCDLYIIVLS